MENLQDTNKPVAWMRTSGTGSPVVTEALLIEMPEMRWNFQQPLYATSPQRTWQGLTDEQFLEACKIAEGGNYMVAFQRIQQWLMEKNI